MPSLASRKIGSSALAQAIGNQNSQPRDPKKPLTEKQLRPREEAQTFHERRSLRAMMSRDHHDIMRGKGWPTTPYSQPRRPRTGTSAFASHAIVVKYAEMQCSALTKTKGRCAHRALPTGTHCKLHGGEQTIGKAPRTERRVKRAEPILLAGILATTIGRIEAETRRLAASSL